MSGVIVQADHRSWRRAQRHVGVRGDGARVGPFWQEPVFVVMVRHPVDLAVSWNQFRLAGGLAEVSLECNLLRWQHMMRSVLHALDAEPATLFAEYETVTGDPRGQARRLAAFLDRQCATASGAGTTATMAAVCLPSLRCNRDGQRREELMTAPQRSLYRLLRQKVHDPRTPLTGDFPMPAGWREQVVSEETSS
jgi:Sulfotransferase domain